MRIVHQWAVYTPHRRGMRVIINPQAEELILHLYPPDERNRNKESLIGGKATQLRRVVSFFGHFKKHPRQWQRRPRLPCFRPLS